MLHRIRHALLLLLPAVGCVSGNPHGGADAAPGQAPLEGGAIMLPAPCGYQVTTRIGATAPVVGTALTGVDPTPRQLHLGVAGDPRTSMVVQWRTVDETTLATTVQYGAASTADASTDGLTFEFSTGFGNDGPRVRMHETHLCGLTPDTLYHYRVGGVGMDGTGTWSPEYTFRTAPDRAVQPDAEVVLLVLGDTRDGYAIWGDLLLKAQTQVSPDLIIFTGDAVTLGPLQEEWDQFYDAGEPVLRETPMVAAHGNHDTNSVNYFSMNAQPGDEDVFGLDYGAVHLTVLNDNPLEPSDIGGKLKDFLDADLTAADAAGAPWTIVMHHMPMWSASTRHGSDTTLRDTWGPLIDAHTVDIVLSGHDHDYERTKPMRGTAPQATPADGTVFLVAGSAGASTYPNGTDFWTEYSEETQNFAIFRVRTGHMEMQAFRQDGSLMDSLIIDK